MKHLTIVVEGLFAFCMAVDLIIKEIPYQFVAIDVFGGPKPMKRRTTPNAIALQIEGKANGYNVVGTGPSGNEPPTSA